MGWFQKYERGPFMAGLFRSDDRDAPVFSCFVNPSSGLVQSKTCCSDPLLRDVPTDRIVGVLRRLFTLRPSEIKYASVLPVVGLNAIIPLVGTLADMYAAFHFRDWGLSLLSNTPAAANDAAGGSTGLKPMIRFRAVRVAGGDLLRLVDACYWCDAVTDMSRRVKTAAAAKQGLVAKKVPSLLKLASRAYGDDLELALSRFPGSPAALALLKRRWREMTRERHLCDCGDFLTLMRQITRFYYVDRNPPLPWIPIDVGANKDVYLARVTRVLLFNR